MPAIKIIKKYYHLTKPGIIYGNLLIAAAGFFVGSSHGINWVLMLLMLFGLACVIGSACVFNNFADRDIDIYMSRTKTRALVKKSISEDSALLFASLLGFLGALLLLFYTNGFAFGAALTGFLVYVFIYTPYKRKSGNALYVGAIAGATPPVVGYAAASGTIDLIALGLFVAMFAWQLPHFLAIAVYRYDEYKAAHIPLALPRPPKNEEEKRTARQIFAASLVLLLLACLASAIWRLFF